MRFAGLIALFSETLLCILLIRTKSVSSFLNKQNPIHTGCSHYLFRGRTPSNPLALSARRSNLGPDATKVLRSGVVVDVKPGTNFLVQLDGSNKQLTCSLAGKLYMGKIRIFNNCRVNVEVDLLYPETGRIVERLDE